MLLMRRCVVNERMLLTKKICIVGNRINTVILPKCNELKWSSKREVHGGIFESCDICLENTPTSHAVSLALFVYACSDSALLSLSCACLSEAHRTCILNLLGNLYPANNYPLHGHCKQSQ